MLNHTLSKPPTHSIGHLLAKYRSRRLFLPHQLQLWVFWGSCAAAIAIMTTFVLYRSAQQYPLDAFEEYEIHKVARWSQGAELYGAEHHELLPEAYPPVYFCLLRALHAFLGQSFVASRFLSLAATAGVVACGVWSLRQENNRPIACAAFLTVFLCLNGLVDRFFDVGKPDMVFLFFLSVALVTGQHRSRLETWINSISLWLACLTKQNAVLFMVPLVCWQFAEGRRVWAIAWGVAMTASIGVSFLILNWYMAGNFLHWVFYWPAGHGVSFSAGLQAFVRTVTLHAPILWIVLAGAMAFRLRDYWTWCLGVSIGVAVMGLSKAGGRDNHLLPLAFVAALIIGNSFAAFWSRAGARSAVCIMMLAFIVPALPGRRDFRWIGKRANEARDWVESVRQLGGSVAVSHHFLLARRAAADCFFSDLILEFRGLQVPDAVQARLDRQEYDYLILCENPERAKTPGWRDLVERNYEPVGLLPFQNISQVLPNRVFRARRLVESPGGF